jgi:hypothetical protein
VPGAIAEKKAGFKSLNDQRADTTATDLMLTVLTGSLEALLLAHGITA